MALKAYDKIKHAVRWWLLRRLPTCKQTVKVISESMERKTFDFGSGLPSSFIFGSVYGAFGIWRTCT